MTPQGIEELKHDEGLRLKKYQDSLGFWSIGYGHLMLKNEYDEITREKAEKLLAEDIETAEDGMAHIFPLWPSFSERRRDALTNMTFQLGVGGLLHFRQAIAHARSGQWKEAADDFRDSLWARQTPARAACICAIIENG